VGKLSDGLNVEIALILEYLPINLSDGLIKAV
jgi:hypothetical protein